MRYIATTTIRVRRDSHDALREIAKATGQSLQAAFDQAIQEMRRKIYLEGLNADYAALCQNPVEWAAMKEQLAEWNGG